MNKKLYRTKYMWKSLCLRRMVTFCSSICSLYTDEDLGKLFDKKKIKNVRKLFSQPGKGK